MQSIVMHVTSAASLSGKQGKSMGRLVRCPGGGSETLPIGREILKPRYYSTGSSRDSDLLRGDREEGVNARTTTQTWNEKTMEHGAVPHWLCL